MFDLEWNIIKMYVSVNSPRRVKQSSIEGLCFNTPVDSGDTYVMYPTLVNTCQCYYDIICKCVVFIKPVWGAVVPELTTVVAIV